MPHPPIITIYKPASGFKAVLLTWNKGYKMYEPGSISDFAYSSPAEAGSYAKDWAEADGIRFIPYKGKYTDGLFVCRNCKGLFDDENDLYCAGCRAGTKKEVLS